MSFTLGLGSGVKNSLQIWGCVGVDVQSKQRGILTECTCKEKPTLMQSQGMELRVILHQSGHSLKEGPDNF